MRIRTKFSFFVIPLAILPLLFVGLFSFRTLIQGFDQQTYLEDQQLSNIAATRIERILDDCRDSILMISTLASTKISKSADRSLERLIAEADNSIQQTAAGFALRHSPHVRIRFLAADGRELFAAQGLGKSFRLGNALTEPIFLQAVAVSGQARFPCQFPPARGNDGVWTTSFSVPLLHNGEIRGFVFLDLDLKAFAEGLNRLTAGSPGYYFLFDGTGNVLAEAGEAPLSEKDPQAHALFAQVRTDPEPVFTHKQYHAGPKKLFINSRPVKEYIYFREHVPAERWYLGTVHAETPLLVAFRQSQRFFLTVLAFGLIVAIAGTFFMARKITTPISQLAAASGKVAQGNLDLNIAVASNDEIGKLAADFNKMATDLKQLMRERQANETLIAVGRFSAALAHDLRNPVEGLKLLSRELRRRLTPNRSEHEIADTISQSVDRLSSLVTQSLDFARLTQPRFSATELPALADEVLRDFRFDGIELRKEYAAALPPVNVDGVQIKRVLMNLIRNALEACQSRQSSPPCQISLKLRPLGDKVSLEVADTGPGIPPEIRERIFEPFFSTKPGGHGLGLALVRQIIANHGGTITFESEMEKGTRFAIELPIAQNRSEVLQN